jgi:hypothetical protein
MNVRFESQFTKDLRKIKYKKPLSKHSKTQY